MVMGKDAYGELCHRAGGMPSAAENEDPLKVDSWHVSGPEDKQSICAWETK